MFGVLRIARDQLTPEQRELYRAHFCASCHAMREVSGRSTSLLTNYDQTVLALVLGGLEGESRPRRSSCTALPLRTVPVQLLSDRSKELLAGLNLAAVEAKLRDNVQDDRSLLARLGLKWLGRPAARVARKLGDRGFPMAVWRWLPERQSRVEAEPTTLDQLASPTAEATATTFAFAADVAERPEARSALRDLGDSLARFIYVFDAWKDRRRDRAKGQFNALDAVVPEPDQRSVTRSYLDHQLSRANHAADRLDLGPQGEILAALLRSLTTRVEHGIPHSTPLHVQRRAEAGECDCGVCEACSCCETGEGCNATPCDCCSCCDCPCGGEWLRDYRH